MSDAAKFWEAVDQAGELREQFAKLLSERDKVPASEVVALGKANGFNFTETELKRCMDGAAGELNEGQLDAISGGPHFRTWDGPSVISFQGLGVDGKVGSETIGKVGG